MLVLYYFPLISYQYKNLAENHIILCLPTCNSLRLNLLIIVYDILFNYTPLGAFRKDGEGKNMINAFFINS